MQHQVNGNQQFCTTPKAGPSIGDMTLDETISAINDQESSAKLTA